MSARRSREDCELAYDTWKRLGNYTAAAQALGWADKTVARGCADAEKYGWRGSPVDVPQGMEIRSRSATVNKHGEISGQSVKMAPHLAQVHESIEGLDLKARTVQIDGEGRVTQAWLKEGRTAPTAAETAKILREALDGFESPLTAITAPESTSYEDLWCLPISDLHIGACYKSNDPNLYWGSEHTIRDFRMAVMQLIDSAPVAETCLIQGCGDLGDYDSLESVTPRHRHVLDTDLSHAEILIRTGELLAWVVDECRKKFGQVVVNLVRGNHDPTATQAWKLYLYGLFQNEPRVEVDLSDDPFNMVVHGKSLLFVGHGDDLKASMIPGFVAAHYPEEWGKTRFRLAIVGHRHHQEKLSKEHGGMVVETLPAICRSNLYARSHGLVSWRGMQSMTISEDGNIKRNMVQFT